MPLAPPPAPHFPRPPRAPPPRAGRAPTPEGPGGGAAGRCARLGFRPAPGAGVTPPWARAGRAQLAGAPPPARRSGRYKRAAAAGRPARGRERDGQPPRRGKMLDGPLLARWLAAAFALTLLLAALRPSAAYFG